MDLKIFVFPDVTDREIKGRCFEKIERVLINEALSRGFYSGNSIFNRLFYYFFEHGYVAHYNNNFPEERRESAHRYLRAIMGSFFIRDETKEAVCALILSELFDIEKYGTINHCEQ